MMLATAVPWPIGSPWGSSSQPVSITATVTPAPVPTTRGSILRARRYQLCGVTGPYQSNAVDTSPVEQKTPTTIA
jgi:hypothetical protein